MIDVSLFITALQIVKVLVESHMIASGLKEGMLLYFLSTMSARNSWYPFSHIFAQKKHQLNVNFGLNFIEIPLITHIFGYYQTVKFEFNDKTLNQLSDELSLWNNELESPKNETNTEYKFRLVLTEESLREVSTNMIIHFIYNFPANVFLP